MNAAETRRGFLGCAGALAAAAMLPVGAARASTAGERLLSFYHTHTGETLKTAYWADGRYLPEGLKSLNRLLRDFRTGDVAMIDPRLFDLLTKVRALTDAGSRPIHIISGYRSPHTNAMLRGRSEHSGVAKKSLHQEGKAMDIRIPGIALDRLRGAATLVQGGGVGFYPASEFVHVDTGRVRYW